MALPRPCTVTAHLPSALGVVDSKSFIDALLADIPKEEVKCVQELRGYFRVTFTSETHKEHFASVGMSISGIGIPLQEADEFRSVRLHNVPFEVPEGNIKAVLGVYGDIKSHRFEMDSNGVCTGTRILRMSIKKDIPNNLSVLSYPFVVWYPGQPKLCRVCQASGHFANRCPNKGLCRICRSPGHFAKSCPDRNRVSSSNPWRNAPRTSSVSDRPGALPDATTHARLVNTITEGVDAQRSGISEQPDGSQVVVDTEDPPGSQEMVLDPVPDGSVLPSGSQEVGSQDLAIAASDAEVVGGMDCSEVPRGSQDGESSSGDASSQIPVSGSVSPPVVVVSALPTNNFWEPLSSVIDDLFADNEVPDPDEEGFVSAEEVEEVEEVVPYKKHCVDPAVTQNAVPESNTAVSSVGVTDGAANTQSSRKSHASDSDGFVLVRSRQKARGNPRIKAAARICSLDRSSSRHPQAIRSRSRSRSPGLRRQHSRKK